MKVRLIEGTTADALADTARNCAGAALVFVVVAWLAFAMMESGWRYAVGGFFLLMAFAVIFQAIDAWNKGVMAGMLEIRPWGNFAVLLVIAAAAVAIYIADSAFLRVGLGILALFLASLMGALACRPKQE